MVRLAGLECKDAVQTITGSYSNQEQISRSQLSRRFGTGWRPRHGAQSARGVLGRLRHGACKPPYTDNPRIARAPITQTKIFPIDGFRLHPWSQRKGQILAPTTGESIMRCNLFEGRRFLDAGAAGREPRRLAREPGAGAGEAQAAQ